MGEDVGDTARGERLVPYRERGRYAAIDDQPAAEG